MRMPGIELNGRIAAHQQCPAASVPFRKSAFFSAAWLVLMCAAGAPSVYAQAPTAVLAHWGAGQRDRVVPAAHSGSAQRLAQWISQERDHQGKPFFLVDKVNATLYVFDHRARLTALSPVLLGAAVGDDSVPGIGNRPMADILPSERTTPAGRFEAEVGRNLKGEDVVWVDHDAAVSMHRLRSSNPIENRAQRMKTPTVDDNRISYGCINVPVAFYNRHIQPAFVRHAKAIVYVMPETRSMEQQFGMAPPTASPTTPQHATRSTPATSVTAVTRVSKR